MDEERRSLFKETVFWDWKKDAQEFYKRSLKENDADICKVFGHVLVCGDSNQLEHLRILLEFGADVQDLHPLQVCFECMKMDINGNYTWNGPLCQLLFEYGIPLEEKFYEDYMFARLCEHMREDLLALRQQYPCIHWCDEPPSWEIQRLIWIAHLKEEEKEFALLPVELIQMIIRYCGENHLTYSERRRKREIKRACTNDVSRKPL